VRAPGRLGGSTVRLHLYVPDVDAAYRRALDTGGTAVAPPADAFWGDRYAIVQDPHGHYWSLATPRESLSPDQLEDRGNAWSHGGS
jgi:PhnB protein